MKDKKKNKKSLKQPGPKIGKRLADLKSRVFTRQNFRYFGLAIASILMYIAMYPPFDFGGLAFFALVPWLIMVVVASGRQQFWISYLVGVIYYLLSVFWLWPVTGIGYVVMAFLFGLYWPIAGWFVSKLKRTFRVPVFLGLPIVWVSLEWSRSWFVTGFAWFFLGHSQVKNLAMIQIADLGGAYAVSFVLAMVSGAIATFILAVRNHKVRSAIPAVVITFVVLISSVLYGQWRLGESTLSAGPTVSVVQDDFPMCVSGECADLYEIFEGYLKASMPLISQKPDMIVWPETCVGASINPEFLNADLSDSPYRHEQPHGKSFAETVGKLAKKIDGYVVTGAVSKEFHAKDHYPQVDKYNSAVIFGPDGEYLDRYDKIRLVLFGEVVPFRYSCRPLYRFLNDYMTPWGKGGYEYSLSYGRELKRFVMSTKPGVPGIKPKDYRYAVAICYEDTMSDLIRDFTVADGGRKQIDFLINISNDGWFNHSCELLQHFYISVFRAVENRISVARSVNTGVSGFIMPTGKIDGMVRDGDRLYGAGIRGSLTRRVWIDSRVTLYSRIGDWPWGIMSAVVLVCGFIGRRKKVV